MDVTFIAAPGPVAPFGEATFVGPACSARRSRARSSISRRTTPIHPRRSPECESSRQIPAVGGVRIVEGKSLDEFGRLPYEVDVEDRLPYAVGGSARYSSTNGPAGQVYFEDRNLFGGAERLRLSADLFEAPPWYVANTSLRSFSLEDLGGRVALSFLKPPSLEPATIFSSTPRARR